MGRHAMAVGIDDFELFTDCTKAELRRIGSLTTYLQVPKDRVLMREGSHAKELIVIGSGTARVTRETDEGVATVADVGSGHFLGGLSLLTGNRRTITAIATTDLEVLVSSVSEFREMLQIAPSLEQKLRQTSVVGGSSLDVAA